MGFLSRQSETAKLDQVVDSLPAQVADWTPEQRAQYTAQSDRAMREQAAAPTRR
ncbi:hypothetical protein AB0C80_18430 [Streptomyces anthocyanicus]|uniref:hypothetical protein n=1 Tax=Streptomyces anthocyanicus TaxID=68174 RepID=UPI0033F2A59B